MRKSHEKRQSEIIQGALDLAAKMGLSNVSTQAIAGRVGIAQPTIFRHFKNRDAIFRAALEFVATNLFKALNAAVAFGGPADERLQKLLSTQLYFIGKRRGVPRLLFSDRLQVEDHELKNTIRRIMERYVDTVAIIIKEGVEEGVFRHDLDPLETAQFVTAAVQGFILRWSLYDFEFPLEEKKETLWRFIWPSIRP